MENRTVNLIGISGKKQSGKNTVADIIQYLTAFGKYDTLQEFLIRKPGGNCNTKFSQVSFAHKLKKIASLLLGRPIEHFENEETKNQLLQSEWDIKTDRTEEVMTVRGFLQKLGTEAMRDNLHPNIWVNALFSDFKPIRNKILKDDSEEYEYNMPNWIVTDVRFPNEAEAILDREGLLLRVFRPGKLRVWYNDSVNSDEEDHSGYYYVQRLSENYTEITEYSDGSGSAIAGDIYKSLEFESSDKHASETALDNYSCFNEIIINDGDIETLTNKVREVLKKYRII